MSVAAKGGGLYAAMWRWHFYAGLFVMPFLFVLATTGIVMALKAPIERAFYGDLLYVEPRGAPRPAKAQAEAVAAAEPEATIIMYRPPRAENRSAEFAVLTKAGGNLSVYVNPYTAEALGSIDPEATLYEWAHKAHGTLFMGVLGDGLIEIAAGLAVLLVASGIYLWRPRGEQSLSRALAPDLRGPGRPRWRNLHKSLGFWLSGFLLFFLISGLAWTPVWGERLTQAWSSFPAERFAAPTQHEDHGALNRGGIKETAWALEQTPLPAAGSSAGAPGIAARPVNLDAVIAFARESGFTTFRVNYPKGAEGVWTVAAATMSGDIADPTQDRTLHIDPYTGAVLADIGFADYSLMGKTMAAGIALHQGEMGPANAAFNLLYAFAVLTMAASGAAMWWLRRPAKGARLAPPPMPKDERLWRGAVALMLALSLAFPLTFLTIAAAAAFDIAAASFLRRSLR